MAFMRDSLKMPIPGDQTIRLKIAPGRPDGQYSPAVKTITTPWIVRDYADFKSEVASISKAESEFKNGGRKILKITDRISGKTFSMAYLDSNKRIISADKLTRPGLAPRESVYERFEFLSQENVTFDAKEIQKKAIQTPLDRLKSEREIPKYANFVDSAHFYPAYIFPSEVLDAEGNPTGKTVTRGYVRIDTFSPDPIKIPGVRGKAGILNPTAKGIGAELRATLANFQQFKVDEVIVDTLGNPGGSLELLLEVSQAFSNKPIDFLSMSVKLNENWMGDIEFLARHMPSPARESYEKALQSMQKSYSEGARMSKPLPMDIIAPFQVLPNTDLKRPFKKVELWVNAGNASCGDIFPAIMQDNGLAKIIGQNTMGAGGNVTSYEQAPNSHAVLRQTESLVFRKDGSLIENVGVKPDLAVDFSEDIRMALRIADYFTGEQPGARKTKTDFDTRASAQDCVNAVTDARLLKPVPNFLK